MLNTITYPGKAWLIVIVYLIYVHKSYVYAQDWQWLYVQKIFADKQKINAGTRSILTYQDSVLVVTGNFDDTLLYQNDTLINPYSNLPGIRISSGYIMKVKAGTGATEWKRYIYGFSLSIAKSSIANDTIYLYGEFLDKMVYGSDTLKTPSGPVKYKGLFLIKMLSDGTFVSGKVVAYSFSCFAEDIIAENGDVFLSGSFDETMIIGSDTITTNTTTRSFFIVRLSSAFNKIWLRWGNPYYRDAQKNLYSALTNMGNKIYISGHFVDSLKADTNNISIHSSGLNGFVGCVDRTNGQFLWIQKLGDVNTRRTLYYDIEHDKNYIYLTGCVTQASNFNGIIVIPDSASKSVLFRLDTLGNIIKIWYSSKGKLTTGRDIVFDRSDNLYWTIGFQDTLKFMKDSLYFLKDTLKTYLAIYKITNDSVTRYIHILSGGMFYVSDAVTDSYGNFYCAGNYIAGDMYADTSLFQLPSDNNRYYGYIGKISCKAPAPKISFSDTAICYNEYAVLSTSPSAYYQPFWNTGIQSNSIQVAGGYYSLVYLDENHCASDTAFIRITQYPKTDVSVFQICDSIYVKDTLPYYHWFYNDSLLITNNNNYLNNVQNGWYIFQSMDNNNCLIRDSILINIQEQKLNIQKLCDSLIASSGNSSVWYLNGSSIDTALSISIVQSGDYYITFTDSAGCRWYSDTIHIEIEGNRIFSTYPNPIKEDFYIELAYDTRIEKVEFINSFGIITHILYENDLSSDGFYIKECEKVSRWHIQQNIERLSPGVYIIRITTHNKNILFYKTIVD